MHDTITGPVFQEMLIFGAASIAKEKQSINDLNVFPVPDGDTGTNMSLTMHAAAQELQKRSPATVDLASSITASALLRGARELREAGGGFEVTDADTFAKTAGVLLDEEIRCTAGEKASAYIRSKLGATDRIFRDLF